MASVSNLTCEYKTNPIGLDLASPRFSWQLQSSVSVQQGAYRLQVFCEDETEPLWDTGRVNRADSVLVPYEGPALRPCTRYRWRVRLWDRQGRDTEYSEEATFETGLMLDRVYQASWISTPKKGDISKMQSAPRMRKSFAVKDRPVRRARLYASALGIYAMRLNGRPVSPDVLCPGWTSYNKRLQYQTWDVTNMLVPGENVMAVSLADGWYRGYLALKDQRNVFGERLALVAHLIITYADGTQQLVVTDGSWKALSETPVRFADFYMVSSWIRQ